MKLFLFCLLISGTCFAVNKPKVTTQKTSECASRRDLAGTKIHYPNAELKSNSSIKKESELELALIEEQMGPPPAPVDENEELRLE